MVDVSKNKKTKISIYIEDKDKRLIEASAKSTLRSLSQYCLYLIYTGLQVEINDAAKKQNAK